MKKLFVLGAIWAAFAGCSKESGLPSGQPRSISTELTCESGSIQVKHYGSEMGSLPSDLRGLCEKAVASPATARSKIAASDFNPAGWTAAQWYGNNFQRIPATP